ncbi:MAG: LysM peptidoglycan-binding domain-containing protein [Steroidobacteraceae bacterium]|nr:LysM peptidoglycan-binding domain-containing protein [Steroidobacteraceae bacterium]
MASSFMIRSFGPARRMAAAALVALAIAVPATGQQGIDRSVIPVSPDAPSTYVVQPGDTLWDISAKFLTDPWYWPEIWHINPQVANPHLIYPGDTLALTWVDGQPRVTVAQGGPARLSPRVREHPLSEAIHAIPYQRIAAFMQRPAVLSAEQVKGAPYVAHGRDHRLISASGQEVYVRRLGDAAPGTRYNVYHVGDELKDPDDGDVLGYQGLFTGEAGLRRSGDPSTMMIVDSARETLDGDILLPLAADPRMDFIPRAPKTKVDGRIMSVIDDRSVVADYDVVIINRGTRHGLEPGHVLAVWEAGEEVRDTTRNAKSRTMRLPDERNGVAMVFKAYDRMSYGLMMQSDREVKVGDAVRSP